MPNRTITSHQLLQKVRSDGGYIGLSADGKLEVRSCPAKLEKAVQEQRYLLTAWLKEERAGEYAAKYGHGNWYLLYPYSTTVWPRSRKIKLSI